MASSVSSPSTYGLCTASGTRLSSANIRSSAPRISRSRFHIPSDLADDRLAEDAGRAHGKGENEEEKAGHLAPAAAEREAGDALQRSEEHADQDDAETGFEPGHHRDREGLEDQRR